MHGVYVLLSRKNGELYTGYAKDVKLRVALHNAGKVPATRARRPLTLVYCELYQSRQDAMHREQYLKSGWGRKYLRKVLHNTLKNQ